MNVEAMNAVTRERARIREAVCTLEHFIKNGDTPNNVMVRRGDVLAILTENIVQPRQVPVQCGCGCTKKTGRFTGTLDDGTPISVGYEIHEDVTPEGVAAMQETHDLYEVSLVQWPSKGDSFYRINSQGQIIEAPWTGSDKQKRFAHYGNVFKTRADAAAAQEQIHALMTGKIPQSEWNLERFKANPVILKSHQPEQTLKQLVVLDYNDGQVYVYPMPSTHGGEDIEDWIAQNTEHSIDGIEWMVTDKPFDVRV